MGKVSSQAVSPLSRLLTTFLCCCRHAEKPAQSSSPSPALEKGKQRRTATPPAPKCASPVNSHNKPQPPSPPLPPPRKSPSPVASLGMKLGLDESWMDGPASEGRWWMEPGSKPYFPGRMKKREKKRIAGLEGGLRPGTAQSTVSVTSGVSGTTVGSKASGGGPRKELPKDVKRQLRATEGTGAALPEAGGGRRRPAMKRGEGYTQHWVRTTNATDLPPLAPRIDGSASASSPTSPHTAVAGAALDVVREENSTPVWLAEERSRLLLDRSKCLLTLRGLQRAEESAGEGNCNSAAKEKAERELNEVEGKLRLVAEKLGARG